MAIRLEKGQRINLEKESGTKLTNFCVGCNWGAIIEKKFFGLSTHVVDVDLDLSCMMFDAAGNVVDHIWSPLYNFRGKLPQGKLDSNDHALHHTGDDLTGDQNGDDGLDNEIITVDLNRVSSNVNSIVFSSTSITTESIVEISREYRMLQFACLREHLIARPSKFLHNTTWQRKRNVQANELWLWANFTGTMAIGNLPLSVMLLKIE